MVYDLGRMDEFHNTDTWDENKANALAAIERLIIDAALLAWDKSGEGYNSEYPGTEEVEDKVLRDVLEELQSKLENNQ